jgi:hypothetical protein
MPRPVEYTPARRMIMQAILWVVLGGAVALAAAVVHQKHQALMAELGPIRISGPIHFRLPADWMVTPAGPMDDPRLAATANEPDNGSGRPAQIFVFRERVKTMIEPKDYLERSGLLNDLFPDPNDARPTLEGEATVGQWPGVAIVGMAHPQLTENDDTDTRLICAVLPDNQALTLVIERAGGLEPSDIILLNLMGEKVTIDDADVQPVAPDGTSSLDSPGVHVAMNHAEMISRG